ncbi:helix-turn-helix transcriptional regulator [uncultured Treponema sp.]|uniref:ArsR/SmtB family transcription factor n=1 Tax=uncultured Treponema sp. TaxID=162155 RepID=UPI0025F7E17E|nr:metalloregulator ArsR/SmtB family transcription factor [uncultured Treponema sp.]
MIDPEKMEQAREEFRTCIQTFNALGDATRQKLCLDLAFAGKEGINVADLAGKSILSRPAISHHLKVLKDVGIVEPVKHGTQIFYRLRLKEALIPLRGLLQTLEEILKEEDEE